MGIKNKKNRYEKLFEKLELNKSFLSELRKIRKKIGIPLKDGFENRPWDKEHIEWKKTHNDNFLDFMNESFALSETAIKIIKNLANITEVDEKNIRYSFYWYVLNGKHSIGQSFKFGPQMAFYFINSLDEEFADFIKRHYKDGIIIAIPPGSTSTEVKRYVDYIMKRKFYNGKREIFSKIIQKPFHIRGYIETDLDKKIIEIHKKYKSYPIKELDKVLGNKKTISYRHYAYRDLLKKEFSLDAKPEKIKTTIRRWNKLIGSVKKTK